MEEGNLNYLIYGVELIPTMRNTVAITKTTLYAIHSYTINTRLAFNAEHDYFIKRLT